MSLGIIDFDEIDNWAPMLAAALSPDVPLSIGPKLVEAAPEFIEDALDLLFELTDRDAVIDATLAWISSKTLMGYHGTRLTDAELASVRAEGLIPLRAEARRNRIIRALSSHPEWQGVVDKLDITLKDYGAGGISGRREGQVHLTLSKAGLVKGFNHYLTHGAEFDQHVAQALLGDAGKELLARDGEPRVIHVAVPGARALEAAHPHFGIDHLREIGDVPNLVGEFLEVWSYRLANPGYQSRTRRADCGMVFYSTIPAEWIVGFNTLTKLYKEE